MIKIAIAAKQVNGTSSTGSSEIRAVDPDTKNKRQVNQYLQTPGTSAITIRRDSGPQVFPIQLSNGIYSQPSLYTRRPTPVSKPQIVENEEEQELQPQQQV